MPDHDSSTSASSTASPAPSGSRDSAEIAADAAALDGEEATSLSVALAFFAVPLLLVVVGVAVFIMFGVVAHEGTSPEEYLAQINGRGINEPWQAAFHLSQQLQFDEQLHGNGDFANRVVRALERSEEGDVRIRRFLATALGRVGHTNGTAALIRQLEDEDPEVRVNSMWALGRIAQQDTSATRDAAGDAIASQLRNDDSSVRTMASYVLGVLRQGDTRTALRVALNDVVPSVRWNAAVALGLMHDPAGIDELAEMIDRETLALVPQITPQQERNTMLAALEALRIMGVPATATEVTATLNRLRSADPDSSVREAAGEALHAMPQAGIQGSEALSDWIQDPTADK